MIGTRKKETKQVEVEKKIIKRGNWKFLFLIHDRTIKGKVLHAPDDFGGIMQKHEFTAKTTCVPEDEFNVDRGMQIVFHKLVVKIKSAKSQFILDFKKRIANAFKQIYIRKHHKQHFDIEADDQQLLDDMKKANDKSVKKERLNALKCPCCGGNHPTPKKNTTVGNHVFPPIKIIKNVIRCKSCGCVIESKHTHDFKNCKCGKVAVDGGHEYLKRCHPTNGSPETFYEELSVTTNGG